MFVILTMRWWYHSLSTCQVQLCTWDREQAEMGRTLQGHMGGDKERLWGLQTWESGTHVTIQQLLFLSLYADSTSFFTYLLTTWNASYLSFVLVLRALHLLGKYFTTEPHLQTFSPVSYFSGWILHFCQGPALDHDPPFYSSHAARIKDMHHHTQLILMKWSLSNFCLS
jgi:hypothetical protein